MFDNFLVDYNLETYLSKEYLTHAVKGEIQNELPEFDQIITRLRDFLNEHDTAISFMGHGQIYTQKFFLDKKNYFTLQWDIDKARYICTASDIPVFDLKVDALAQTISWSTVELKYLKQGLRNEEPIIVVSLPMLEKFVVIDGNHRVISRFKKKVKAVKGYLLEPDAHVPAMTNDISRALLCTIGVAETIKAFLAGKVAKDELMKTIKILDTFDDEISIIPYFFGKQHKD